MLGQLIRGQIEELSDVDVVPVAKTKPKKAKPIQVEDAVGHLAGYSDVSWIVQCVLAAS